MEISQPVLSAFSEEQVEKLTGISRTQLKYWDRTAFYRPSFAANNRRSAYSRVYSFKDVIALRVLNVLRNEHKISLQYLRDVKSKLRALGPDPEQWTDAKLYPFCGKVIWHEPDTELPQVVASGQYVAAIALNDVVQQTKSAIIQFKNRRDKSTIGQIERSKYVVRNAPVLAGTRIPVAAIKRFSEAGFSTAQILKEYPDLTERDVRAALRYRERKGVAA